MCHVDKSILPEDAIFKDYDPVVVQTAKKLGVSAYEYFNDRVSKSFKMPSLAELIGAKKYSTFSCKDNG